MTRKVGQYELLDLLGDGGMGTVHRGRDPRFDRPVAIKVLHAQFARDPEVSERFRAEAVIQAKLNHPNIVTVYDFLAEGDQLAMVMELVEGQTLAELISGPLWLPEATVVTVMSQVLSAVGFAHGKGLVHRDLKPSNVMVQDLGGGELVAKVMDFGIAKILGAEKMRTATSAKMGTLAYMSPEQLRSPKSVDHRSDIYSLGAMVYEMLTGRVPYDADTEYELMRKAIEEEPPAPSWVVPDLGSRWDAAVTRAMAKDPAHRFQSGQEMRTVLLKGGEASGGNPFVAAQAGAPTAAMLRESEAAAEHARGAIREGMYIYRDHRRVERGLQELTSALGWAADRDSLVMEARRWLLVWLGPSAAAASGEPSNGESLSRRPPSGESLWWVTDGSATRGPMPEAQVRAILRSEPRLQVCVVGGSSWQSALALFGEPKVVELTKAAKLKPIREVLQMAMERRDAVDVMRLVGALASALGREADQDRDVLAARDFLSSTR